MQKWKSNESREGLAGSIHHVSDLSGGHEVGRGP